MFNVNCNCGECPRTPLISTFAIPGGRCNGPCVDTSDGMLRATPEHTTVFKS